MTSDSGERVVIVTGGSDGIGEVAVKRLAADGVSVVIHYAGNPAPANEVVTAITAAGGTASSFQADVADEGKVAAPDEWLATRVTITLRAGEKHEVTTTHPRGAGDRALRNDEITDKYRALTARTVQGERSKAIEQAALGIEHAPNVAELVELLTPTVTPALD